MVSSNNRFSKAMRQQNGFTLIELIVVIIILGILSITAVPKLLNIARDARIATLDGFLGSFNAADSMVMAKANISGVSSNTNIVNVPNTDLYIRGAHMSIKPEHLVAAMIVDGYSMASLGDESELGTTFVYLGDKIDLREAEGRKCYIQFSNSIEASEYEKIHDLTIRKEYSGC